MTKYVASSASEDNYIILDKLWQGSLKQGTNLTLYRDSQLAMWHLVNIQYYLRKILSYVACETSLCVHSLTCENVSYKTDTTLWARVLACYLVKQAVQSTTFKPLGGVARQHAILNCADTADDLMMMMTSSHAPQEVHSRSAQSGDVVCGSNWN